jgi:prefoldin subunit 5
MESVEVFSAGYSWPPKRRELESIQRKLDLIINKIGVVMADVAPLTAAIEELDTDEVAAVDEFKALAEQIAQLTTEKAPSQEELDALTAKATAIAAALKAGTPTQAAPVEPVTSADPAEAQTTTTQEAQGASTEAPAAPVQPPAGTPGVEAPTQEPPVQ